MKKVIKFLLLLGMLILPEVVMARSDQDIIQEQIAKSIAGYPGDCPCPYSKDKSGNLCGDKSGYSNPTDYQPFCYPEDVSDFAVDAYRIRPKHKDFKPQEDFQSTKVPDKDA